MSLVPLHGFNQGFPVVSHVTQITNDVPFSLAYYRDTRHYPSRHSDLPDGGGNPCCSSQRQKDPGSRGDKSNKCMRTYWRNGNKVGEFCLE
jgi:hypothetical protein